jgi:hypothetical protein
VCEYPEQCFWPFPNQYGSVADATGYSENHTGWKFVGPGAGQGHTLNDWAMSAKNRDDYLSNLVCRHSWFRGPCIHVNAGYSVNLPSELSNNNSSHLLGG